jgi:hypothetical protein
MAREFVLRTSVWVRVYSQQLILILSMRKIDWRHPACLWRHWEVWNYHRSINKWKGYKLRKRYEKGTKLQQKVLSYNKRYEATKKIRSYEKGTKLRKSYEVTNMVRSYEKGTKMLRNKLRKALVMKLQDSNATYRDNLLWSIVIHYGEMPRATLVSSDLRSQVAIFGKWNIYSTRNKIFC